MIDYLEKRLGSGGALLKQARQSERELSGPTEANGEERGSGRAEGKWLGRRIVSANSESVDDRKKAVNSRGKKVDGLFVPGSGDGGEKEDTVSPLKAEENPAALRGWSWRESIPTEKGSEQETEGEPGGKNALAEQLKRLDRMAFAQTGEGWLSKRAERVQISDPTASMLRERSSYLSEGGMLDRKQAMTERAPAIGGAAGGELQWAERADRLFRRDSRRYDGAFYLY